MQVALFLLNEKNLKFVLNVHYCYLIDKYLNGTKLVDCLACGTIILHKLVWNSLLFNLPCQANLKQRQVFKLRPLFLPESRFIESMGVIAFHLVHTYNLIHFENKAIF